MSCEKNKSIKIAKDILTKQGIQLQSSDDPEYDPAYLLVQSFLEQKQLSILSKYRDRLKARNVPSEKNKINIDKAIHTYFCNMENDYASVSEEDMDNMVDAILLSESLLIHISNYYPIDMAIVNKLSKQGANDTLISDYNKHQHFLFSKYSDMFYIPYKKPAKRLLNIFRDSDREM